MKAPIIPLSNPVPQAQTVTGDGFSAETFWTLIAIAVLTVPAVIAWSASSTMVMVGAMLMALVVLSLMGLIWWTARMKRADRNADV